MKIQKKLLFLGATFALAMSTLAATHLRASYGEWKELGARPALWIAPESTPDDVENTLMWNLSGFLRRYHPAGNGISNYFVNGDGISATMGFKATKQIGPFSKSANVVAYVTQPQKIGCDGIAGYRLHFDFGRSDDLIKDNAISLVMDLCLIDKGDGSHGLNVTSSQMQEGGDFGGATGRATVNLLAAQVWPLMESIGKTITQRTATR